MANLMHPAAAPMPTSEYVGTSVADPTLGTRWRDSSGNEYTVVDCQQALVAGEWVYIDVNNLATRLTTGVVGRVGIMASSPTTSDTKAYVQIFGLYAGAAGTSLVQTSLPMGPNASWCDIGVATGVPTSSAGAELIYNAFAYTAPDSATTSPPSSFVTAAGTSSTAIGFSVWLNYPYVFGTTFLGGTT